MMEGKGNGGGWFGRLVEGSIGEDGIDGDEMGELWKIEEIEIEE